MKTPANHINADTSIRGLKYFKESDFHEVMGQTEDIRTFQPDEGEGHGFKRGDRVEFGLMDIGTLCEEKTQGTVSGIQGSMVRVGIALFHPSRLRKL